MVQAFDSDGDLATTEGENDVENAQCSAGASAGWTDPRAVESIVSNVLWDLIDGIEDPANSSGVDEVADVTPEQVLDVITAPMLPHLSCSPTDLNSHPMGLDEFWDEWRRQHPGVVPDLFAAYAFNGADRGNATDVTPPAPVTLASPSHTPGAWSNDSSVTLDIVDGADDVSGSYSYFIAADTSETTAASTSGVPTFKSKLTSNQREVVLPEGVSNYIHVNTLDMAAHPGTASAHFGPVKIDTTDPYLTSAFSVIPFRIDPTVPSSDPTLMLGYPARINWSSHDDLSGVVEVRLAFRDPFTGFSMDLHTTSDESGSHTWLVTDVPVTPTGELTITVTDLVGNDITESIPAPVVAPLAGPIAANLGADSDPCEDGRVISADLHGDGYDDVVLVCRFNLSGHLYVFRGGPNGPSLAQHFPWRPADDLTAADYDRDGDLDIFTVSLDVPGAATELELLTNDGTGNLIDPGILRPLGPLDQKTVRVVHDSKKPILAVFGVQQPGNVPAVLAFDLPAGLTAMVLPGVDPVDGDWEASDVNGDGYVDLVALGADGAGTEALSLFTGWVGGWNRQDLETYPSVTKADVDLGDFDSDGRPDIFVMFEGAGLTRVTKLLRRAGVGLTFSSFAAASTAPLQVAQGDGFIVDTANDALSEVIAMGSTDTGSVSGWYLRNDALVGTLENETIVAMVPLGNTDTAWGDFDADGDLDVFQVGHVGNSFHIACYENQLGTYIDQNDSPKSPSSLSAAYDNLRGGYVFSWSAPVGGNDETPVGGFGYELRVGTSKTGGEVLSWAHPAGASQQGHSLQRFVQMPQGTYWYDVRTVDSGWRRSLPAGVKQTIP